MDWQPYNPSWLVDWLRETRPEYESLADALSRCTRAWRDLESEERYQTTVYHFVPRDEFVRYFSQTFLDGTPNGPVLLNIQDDEEIGSLQLLSEEAADSIRPSTRVPLAPGDIDYTAEQVRKWARRLKYFRICRERPGEPYCSFKVWIRYVTEAELLEISRQVGFPIRPVPPDNPRPIPNVPVLPDFRFETPIDHLPHLAQPGWVLVGGQEAFVWVSAGMIMIKITDTENRWYVSDAACDSAVLVESRLATVAARVLEPSSLGCITPEGHPCVWRDA